jgi:hypothetical protein
LITAIIKTRKNQKNHKCKSHDVASSRFLKSARHPRHNSQRHEQQGQCGVQHEKAVARTEPANVDLRPVAAKSFLAARQAAQTLGQAETVEGTARAKNEEGREK